MTWSVTNSWSTRKRSPRQIYDQAAQTAAAAKATVDTRIAAVNEARHNVTAADAAVQQAQAKIPQAEASIQSALTAPQQVAVSQSRAQSSASQGRSAGSIACPSQAQQELHHHLRALGRNCRQEDRGGWPVRISGTAAHGHRCSTQRCLGDCQFPRRRKRSATCSRANGCASVWTLTAASMRVASPASAAPAARASACSRRRMPPETM